MVYRKSQKELKDNLENIPAIPVEVRELFQVSLLYEQEPTDKNFKAMHNKVLLMNAECKIWTRRLADRTGGARLAMRRPPLAGGGGGAGGGGAGAGRVAHGVVVVAWCRWASGHGWAGRCRGRRLAGPSLAGA